jgi:hypothetical protein
MIRTPEGMRALFDSSIPWRGGGIDSAKQWFARRAGLKGKTIQLIMMGIGARCSERPSPPTTAANHAWKLGTNENINGLVRQYLPKGHSMAGLHQGRCNVIAGILNARSPQTTRL